MAGSPRNESRTVNTTEKTANQVESRVGDDGSFSKFAHDAIENELQYRRQVDILEQTLLLTALGGALVWVLSLAVTVANVPAAYGVATTAGTMTAMLFVGYVTKVAYRKFTDGQ